MNFNDSDWTWANQNPTASGAFFTAQKDAIKKRLDREA